MLKQTIFIINFNSLYEILDEIKEDLSFKIINYENENVFINDNFSNLKNSLIVLNPNQKIEFNEILSEKNFLNIKTYPLSLNKLIESINIQLIKLKFNYQSKININGYELDLNSKFFSKSNESLKLTEKEIDIILYLIKDKIKHDVIDLQKNIWGYPSNMETHTVETHIYRLRKKINSKFKDNNFILTHKNGYYIE